MTAKLIKPFKPIVRFYDLMFGDSTFSKFAFTLTVLMIGYMFIHASIHKNKITVDGKVYYSTSLWFTNVENNCVSFKSNGNQRICGNNISVEKIRK